jgi:hypothetical protein
MSVSKNGVSFDSGRRKKRFGIFALVLVLEGAFTFLLYLSLVGHIFSPDSSQATAGVPKLISYQGRLTDTSGNPLGGVGTYYCFRYSIYDAVTSGNKVWPAGTPTTATTTVRDGVFSDQVGRLDSLTGLDFFATSTLYLNVEANTATTTCSGSWETLSPRQQITAAGFALTSDDVYGDALRTPTSTKVQVGTGLGVSSGQTLLSLDVKNVADSLGAACTDNGSIWYNSINTRALICEAGIIQPISNSSTTISGIGTNATAPIVAGNVVFSNSNGVSFGQNGSTITASVNAGGGGGAPNMREFDNLGGRISITNITNLTATGVTQRPLFFPFYLPGNLTQDKIALELSRATSGSNLFTAHAAIYTFVNNTQISRLASLSNSFSNTATASISGIRRLILTGMETAGTALTAGNYVLMLYFSANGGNTASINYSLRGGQTAAPPVGQMYPGANSQITATNQLSSIYMKQFQGRYTATTNSPPSSVNLTQVQGYTSMVPAYFQLFSS